MNPIAGTNDPAEVLALVRDRIQREGLKRGWPYWPGDYEDGLCHPYDGVVWGRGHTERQAVYFSFPATARAIVALYTAAGFANSRDYCGWVSSRQTPEATIMAALDRAIELAKTWPKRPFIPV